MPENFRPPEGYSITAEEMPAPGELSLTETETALCLRLCAVPPCPVSEARGLRMAAAVCALEAIGAGAKIHWPGEIMLTDKALCHVLLKPGKDSLLFQVELETAALEAAGIDKSPESILESIARALGAAVSSCPENLETAAQRYCQDCVTLMKFVSVTYRGLPVYGFAFAVDRHGGLMVMTQESHTVVTVYSGAAALGAAEPEAPEMPPMPRI